MITSPSVLSLAHLVGLALGVGSATVKLTLLLRCRADRAFVPVYLQVTKPITRYIVLGMALLTLSGIGWLLLGYPITRLLVVKLALVATIFVLGPIIDNVAEPRFRQLAPATGAPAAPDFIQAQKRLVTIEMIATAAFYVIVVGWVLA